MTIIYKHEAQKTDCYDTRRIVVERLYDGSTDITTIVGECGKPAAFMRHNLSIAESDKFGATICKDIIDNYRRHAANLKDKIVDLENADREMRYRNTNLAEQVTNLKYKNATLARTAFEHDNEQAATIDELHDKVAGLQKEIGDCRKACFHLLDERNEYQKPLCTERADHIAEKCAINQAHHDLHKRNNSTIEELRTDNTKLEQCINLHNLCFAADPVHCENIGVPVYGMRSSNFENLIKGYHGTLSRHGKTIVITLPFEHETVAINAVEYITGHDEHVPHIDAEAE